MLVNWIKKPLGECFRLKSGDMLTAKNMNNEGEYSVFGGNGIAGKHDLFNLVGNNVIIGRVGALCGNARNIKEKIWLTDNAFKVIDCQYELDNSFLAYLLNFKNLRSFARQAAQPVISNVSLKDIVLSFPESLPEQKRIVSVLDEAFAAIEKAKENAEKNLRNASELFESYLQKTIEAPAKEYDEKTLKEITSILGDGLHGTPKYSDNGDYYFINGNNLNNGKIEIKERTKRVSFKEFEKYKKNLTDRTILVSINGTLGNVAFYNNEKIILGKSACYFNLLDGNNKNYIKYVFLSPQFNYYAHSVATGATIKNVSLKSMRSYLIKIPTKTQQESIVTKLDSLLIYSEKLQSLYTQKLSALDELKQSLLHKAFSGEL